jgi:uncharacterized membrane protein
VIFLSDESQTDKTPAGFFEKVFPADLSVALLWLAANILAIYFPGLNELPISAISILAGILILPGYCFIAALFPKNSDIDLTERIVLSIGLSIAIVPLIGLGLNFTPFGIRLNPILISLTLFTLVMILAAHYRRALLPVEKRFRFPFSVIAGTFRNGIFPQTGSRVYRLLTLVTTLVMLTAVLAAVYTITVPKEGERYTEFFILGENKLATDYPDQITAGLNYPMFIGIGNHEHRNIDYTVETWFMRMEFDNATNSSTLLVMDPGERLVLPLAHNETMIIPYNLSVRRTGYNRVEFLLFNETVPGLDVTGRNRMNASYQNLNLWITVR